MIGHRDLADVVQQCSCIEGLDLGLAQAKVAREAACIDSHSIDVIMSDLILGVDCSGKRLDSRQVQPADSLACFRAIVGPLGIEMRGCEDDRNERNSSQ
jgi:hypothetical protein